MNEHRNNKQQKVWSRSRPLRVAYLVEKIDQWSYMLDAIFAECYSRWGGRFSLIVPFSDNLVQTPYGRWLKVFDPDIIYSYIDLDEHTIELIHESYYPSYLIKHEYIEIKGKECDARSYRPRLPIKALSSLSVSPILSHGSSISEPQPFLLVDTYWGTDKDGFIGDSLGSYQLSFEPWPLPQSLSYLVKLLTLIPENVLNNPRNLLRPNGETVTQEINLLEYMTRSGNIFSLAQMLAFLSPRMEIRVWPWSNSFNLIVGDSYEDRIIFWNSKFLIPAYLDKDLTSLRVPLVRFESDQFVNVLSELIKQKNKVSRNNSPNAVTIRSYSVDENQLSLICHKFKETKNWNLFYTEKILSIDSCVPEPKDLDHADRLVEAYSFDCSPDREELNVLGSTFRPPKAYPRHMKDYQIIPPGIRDGVWALDIDIERSNDYCRYDNVKHHWRLPRRLRTAGIFRSPYFLNTLGGTTYFSRVVSSGLLSIFVNHEFDPPEIYIPEDDQIFKYAIHRGKDWWPFDRERSSKRQEECIYQWSCLSDKGRYLSGIIHLFGHLLELTEFLLHKFWLEEFSNLGASQSIYNDRYFDDVKQKIKKQLNANENTFTISNELKWNSLAKLVILEAHRVRFPQKSVDFSDLQDHWSKMWDLWWEKHKKEVEDVTVDWKKNDESLLITSIQNLCEKDVLFQGYEWRCEECYHINWISIGNLDKTMSCEVCGKLEPAPIEKPWHFRLNGFLIEGIKEHGILPLVWCLDKLLKRAHSSFFFTPSLELWNKYPEENNAQNDAEIDLLGVIDGEVFLCEVKSSDRIFDINKLVEVSKRLRPDIVILSIMAESNTRIQQRFNELTSFLDGHEIKTELMTFEENDIDDDPSLPITRKKWKRLL